MAEQQPEFQPSQLLDKIQELHPNLVPNIFKLADAGFTVHGRGFVNVDELPATLQSDKFVGMTYIPLGVVLQEAPDNSELIEWLTDYRPDTEVLAQFNIETIGIFRTRIYKPGTNFERRF